MRERICLGGFWEYSAPFSAPIERMVPGSYHCVGTCDYRRTIHLPPAGDRTALLCFEGIAYQGDVTVNGVSAGETMQPFSRYVFDVTSLLQDGENEIRVALVDLPAVFGPSEGWENYSGIVRDVHIDYVPKAHIEDVFFHQKLSSSLDLSDITVDVTAAGGDAVQIRLALGGRELLFAASEPGAKTVSAQCPFPALWSPESPVLYDLTVELTGGGRVLDAVTEKVGIKDFSIDGNRFLLNGAPCFLKGVCRHDMWGEQGFTLTDAQIEQDLRMIKEMGANFVRLVHYPHDVRVIDAADRIGLMVSEEPGLWWSDMSNPGVTSGALQVLGRTIRRDRNRASVAFWLAFNECIFTEKYLEDTEKLVRSLDPTRAVSGANCMNLKMTKDLFSKYNWDFYTFHPYGPLPAHVTAGYGAEGENASVSIDDVVAYLGDKPLVFTEWGGWFVHDNPALFKRFMEKMASYAAEREDGLRLSGMSYWCWNDMYELNRGGDACVDGILVEGFVDIHRNKRTNYYTQADCFHAFDHLLPHHPGEVEVLGVEVSAGRQTVVDIYAGQDLAANEAVFSDALEKAKANRGFFQHKKIRLLSKGPVLPWELRNLGELHTRLEARIPLIVRDGPVRVTVGAGGNMLYLVGMTTLCDAFPLAGKPGEALARLTVRYADGTQWSQELLSGKELCTAFMSYGSSRIDPRAGASKRALTFSYDKNWERYCLNALPVSLEGGKIVASVELAPSAPGTPVLLYGITVAG
jgi:beta-glucuronidase